jgi:hypothetical protein
MEPGKGASLRKRLFPLERLVSDHLKISPPAPPFAVHKLRGLRESALLRGAPFLASDLPEFCGEASRDVVALFDGDDAHALFFGDAAGG